MTYRCDVCNSKNDPCECEELKEQTESVEMENDGLKLQNERLVEAYEEIKNKNKILRDALEFYASQYNWGLTQNASGHNVSLILNDSDMVPNSIVEYLIPCGGKRAREVLSKVGEK